MNGSLLAVKLDGGELYTSIEVSEIEGIIEGDVVNEQNPVREVFE